MKFFKLGGKILIVNKNQEALKRKCDKFNYVKIRKIILSAKYTISKQKKYKTDKVFTIYGIII